MLILMPDKPVTKITEVSANISGTAVIHFSVYQNTNTGCSNHTVKQEGNTADNRTGYGADKGGELADEGAHNGQHSCSRNHAHAVYTGDCHDSDILAIGGGGHRAISPDIMVEKLSPNRERWRPGSFNRSLPTILLVTT